MRDLTIVMPVFNERATIARAVERVLAADLPVDGVELVIVDDDSVDGTREWLTGASWPAHVQLLLHDRNRGKGAAVVTALTRARGRYVTIMDADLEYDPQTIAALLRPVQQ